MSLWEHFIVQVVIWNGSLSLFSKLQQPLAAGSLICFSCTVSKTLPPIFYKGIVFTILMCQGLAAASSKAWICWRPATTKHQQTFAATDSCPEDCVERFLLAESKARFACTKKHGYRRRRRTICSETNMKWRIKWCLKMDVHSFPMYLRNLRQLLGVPLSFEKIIGGPGQIEPTKKINRRN